MGRIKGTNETTTPGRRNRRWSAVPLLIGMALLGGCSGLGYSLHTLRGGAGLLMARRPVERVVADPATSDEVRRALGTAEAIRRFAHDELALDGGRSYTTYVDLDRPFVTWTVSAAPELSVEPVTWCFPVVGCVSYRGYFRQRRAEEFAARLREEGYDVAVSGVPAYSTLGWFADPLLSTFLLDPEPRLAGLLFHELAHRVAFAPGDTTFNESYATFVEREGVRRWLSGRGQAGELEAWEASIRRQDRFLALLNSVRTELEIVYAADRDDAWKRERKAGILESLRDRAEELAVHQGIPGGYDEWFSTPVNNARLAAVGAYHDRVPAFAALHRQVGGDFATFHSRVRELAALDVGARADALDACGAGEPTG